MGIALGRSIHRGQNDGENRGIAPNTSSNILVLKQKEKKSDRTLPSATRLGLPPLPKSKSRVPGHGTLRRIHPYARNLFLFYGNVRTRLTGLSLDWVACCYLPGAVSVQYLSLNRGSECFGNGIPSVCPSVSAHGGSIMTIVREQAVHVLYSKSTCLHMHVSTVRKLVPTRLRLACLSVPEWG